MPTDIGYDLGLGLPPPPIDLDDQGAIELALGAAQSLPSSPADLSLLAPPVLPDLGPGLPPPPELEVLPDVTPPPVPGSPGLPRSPADLGIEQAPPDLAPDFRRVDYARALDRLEAPRIDPTTAAETAARAEENLRRLETEQAAAQDRILGLGSDIDDAEQALRAAPPGPDRDALAARVAEMRAALDADRGRYQALRGEVDVARRGRASARAQYQTDLEASSREGEVLAAAAQAAAQGAAAAEDEQLLRQARAREGELREVEAAARSQLDRDRQAYRDLLERGPETTGRSVALSIASVIGEVFAARASNRPPDFARALAPVEQATREDFQRRVQARLAAIDAGDDALKRAAREREVLASETATRRAEGLATIERELERRILGARGAPLEAQLLAVRDDVRAAREAKEAEVLAANAKLERERQREALEMRELQAKVSLAERKARPGTGGRARLGVTADSALAALPPQERERIETRGVRDPVTGAWLRTKDGGYVLTADPKAATQLREQLGAVRDYSALSGRLADLVAEHGYATKLWPNEVRQEMDSIVADLLFIVKTNEQTGALDKGSVEVITDKIGGGVVPGDFGSSAETILKTAERMEKRLAWRVRDLSVSGTPEGLAFPDTKAQRGEIERQARAGEEARRLSTGGDHTGTPTAADPLGEADSADKFAADVRTAVTESENALKQALAEDSGASPALAMIPGMSAQVARAPRLRELATQIRDGDRTPATRDEFERLARETGLIGERRNFLFPTERSANLDQARSNERRADAVRVANWLVQKQADPRQVDLGYLRKIGVLRYEHEDRGALAAEIRAAYRRYTQPTLPATEGP
jgi:hypothetical protein